MYVYRLKLYSVEETTSYLSVFLSFSLVTINRQTFSIHRENSEIIRDFIGHHQSANLV